MTLVAALAAIFVSMLIIWRATDGFETASNWLGRNLSDGVRGATINAIGSSMPEFLTVLVGLVIYANSDGFAVGLGTTAGSALFNTAIIPALVVMAVVGGIASGHIAVSRKVVLRDGIALLLAEVLLLVLILGGQITWWHGSILVAAYLLYLGLLFSGMGPRPTAEEVEAPEIAGRKHWLKALVTLSLDDLVLGKRAINTGNAWLLLFVATAVIGAGTWLLVEAVLEIGHEIGVSAYIVAVILAAAATSVPDTILSVRDAKNGAYDDAVANALGSNVFDITMCIGLPVLLYSLVTGSSITISGNDAAVVIELQLLLILFTALSVLLFWLGNGLRRSTAAALIGVYSLFVAYVILRTLGLPPAVQISQWLQSLVGLL